MKGIATPFKVLLHVYEDFCLVEERSGKDRGDAHSDVAHRARRRHGTVRSSAGAVRAGSLGRRFLRRLRSTLLRALETLPAIVTRADRVRARALAIASLVRRGVTFRALVARGAFLALALVGVEVAHTRGALARQLALVRVDDVAVRAAVALVATARVVERANRVGHTRALAGAQQRRVARRVGAEAVVHQRGRRVQVLGKAVGVLVAEQHLERARVKVHAAVDHVDRFTAGIGGTGNADNSLARRRGAARDALLSGLVRADTADLVVRARPRREGRAQTRVLARAHVRVLFLGQALLHRVGVGTGRLQGHALVVFGRAVLSLLANARTLLVVGALGRDLVLAERQERQSASKFPRLHCQLECPCSTS